MRYLYLLRHCTTEYNESEIVQGACDSPLSQKGRKQADEIGSMFSGIPFDHVYTGNQGRHVETARRILRKNHHYTGPEPTRLPGLNEQNLGAFDQKSEQKLYNAASRLYEKNHGLKKGSTSTKELLMHHNMTMVELSSIFHDMDTSGKTETSSYLQEGPLQSC